MVRNKSQSCGNATSLGTTIYCLYVRSTKNQCNHVAQEVRVVSEANSSQTIKKFEGRIEGLATEVMQERLTSKFMDDDIKDMQLQLDDRDGQLLHLQQEEGAVQASVAMTPPGLPLPNGFHLGDGTATGTGQDTTDTDCCTRLTNRME